jgi:DNA polymerase III delta subunit
MLTLIIGENLAHSRAKLVELLEKAKTKQVASKTLEAKSLSLAKLEENLSSQNLFGEKQLLVVEALHSLPRSKRKDQLITLINQAEADNDIILWEKKALTKTQLKKFSNAQVLNFPLSKAIWKFLDQFSPSKHSKIQQLKTLATAAKQDSAELCLIMLIKRVRELIQTLEGVSIKAAPFVKSKLQKQVRSFNKKQLLTIHQALYELDQRIKTSTNLLSVKAELDLLIINL